MRFMPTDLRCIGARAEVRRSVMAGGEPRFRQAHIETCQGCQAEVAEFRDLKTQLASLRTERIDAPSGLVATVLSRLDEALPVRDAVRKASRMLAVSTASGAAALAAIIVVARRRATQAA